jgi:hypothetical protein
VKLQKTTGAHPQDAGPRLSDEFEYDVSLLAISAVTNCIEYSHENVDILCGLDVLMVQNTATSTSPSTSAGSGGKLWMCLGKRDSITSPLQVVCLEQHCTVAEFTVLLHRALLFLV